jgi:hypothetical protein
MGQLREVIDKTARALFKSLGGLLALQETIAGKWLAAHHKNSQPPTAGEIVDSSAANTPGTQIESQQ